MSLPFERILETILPTPSQTALLRACLADDDASWRQWRDEHGGPRAVLAGARDGVKRLLPLLAVARKRTGVDEDHAVLTCLRTAYLREEFRSRTFRAICHRVFEALTRHDVPFVVLRGAALAETDYDDPALRHCHDCDLLVHPDVHDRAIEAISTVEFSIFRETPGDRRHTILTHTTGLPVQLHESLWDVPSCPMPADAIIGRAVEAEICGVPCRVLCPADELLHVLAHAAFTQRRETLVWACDAWMILHGARAIDWDVFTTTTQAAGVALPVHRFVQYMIESLDAPIPADVRAALADAARSSGPLARQATLFGVACGPRGGVSEMWSRTGDLRERLTLLRWMFLPAPVHVRWAYGLTQPSRLPAAYLLRPLHGVLRRFRWYRERVATEPAALPEFMDETRQAA